MKTSSRPIAPSLRAGEKNKRAGRQTDEKDRVEDGVDYSLNAYLGAVATGRLIPCASSSFRSSFLSSSFPRASASVLISTEARHRAGTGAKVEGLF